MAAELGVVAMNQLQKLAQQQGNLNGWAWTGGRLAADHGEESWEVRAFADDTSSAMGTTWPPRSYTCSFCGREFRSAQALGGHMNVHRRDRARLRQCPPGLDASSKALSPSVCFTYPMAKPELRPSTALSISTYHGNGAIPSYQFMGPKENNSSYTGFIVNKVNNGEALVEEIDLELRLGR